MFKLEISLKGDCCLEIEKQIDAKDENWQGFKIVSHSTGQGRVHEEIWMRRQEVPDSRQETGDSRQQAIGRRQQAADSRQQAAGNRQQTIGSRQQAAGSRQQIADSRQQAAGSRQQTADSRQKTAGADSRQYPDARHRRHFIDVDGGSLALDSL
jgi:uncharacterized protein YjbJ (UPF0337 family)